MDKNRTAIMAVIFFLAQAVPLFAASPAVTYSPNPPLEIASKKWNSPRLGNLGKMGQSRPYVNSYLRDSPYFSIAMDNVNEILKSREIKPHKFYSSSPVEISV